MGRCNELSVPVSSLISVIKDFPFFDDFSDEETIVYSTLQRLFDFLWGPYNNIHRKLTRVQYLGNSAIHFLILPICFDNNE